MSCMFYVLHQYKLFFNTSMIVLPAFKAFLFSLQGEERRHKQTNKQTNKEKNDFCFIGSEAETHDVISDVVYLYVGMNVRLCKRVDDG